MLLALLIAAQSADAKPPTLAALRPFVGACWRADFSPTVHDTHCFEYVYGGAHIRDRHEVRDKARTVYAGETVYSVDGPDLVFTYFNSLGGGGQGKVGASGRMIGFTGTMRPSPDKPSQTIDREWKIIDADRYEVRSLVPSPSRTSNPVLSFKRVEAKR